MPPLAVASDASVAHKWFHEEGEEEVEGARAILDLFVRRAITLSVLDLTPYEIGNALLRGRAAASASEVSEVLGALATICPRISASTAELHGTVTLAETHHLTVYDAAYASVARERGAMLATVDQARLRAGLGLMPSQVVALANAEASDEVTEAL